MPTELVKELVPVIGTVLGTALGAVIAYSLNLKKDKIQYKREQEKADILHQWEIEKEHRQFQREQEVVERQHLIDKQQETHKEFATLYQEIITVLEEYLYYVQCGKDVDDLSKLTLSCRANLMMLAPQNITKQYFCVSKLIGKWAYYYRRVYDSDEINEDVEVENKYAATYYMGVALEKEKLCDLMIAHLKTLDC